MGSPTLRIRLFGALDLSYDEKPLPAIESARAESLLAYLLLHRATPQPRQRLAFVLWPDSTEQQARTNLRHLLHKLRRALPDCDRFLDIQPRTLQWRTHAPYWLDVAAFQEALSRATGDPEDLSGLSEAVELYTEDLLTTCYDEWILDEREQLRQHYLTALDRLVTSLAARGEHRQAIQYAERLLRHDPLQEETYRLLMHLYDGSGDRARALRTYHACATLLERELGVEPSAPTREVYEGLLPFEREAPNAKPQAAHMAGMPFVGRAAERRQLTALWRVSEEGRSQLVLMTGEPGVGKTRLVEEFRSWCIHRGILTAEARSYAAEGALAYGPIVAWLRSETIMARVKRLDRVHLAELVRLLPELRTSVPDLNHPDPLPESEQRQRLFDALARALLAPGAPILLVADDLQWCDQETLQFLHYLLRSKPYAPVLVAATARREDLELQHPLHGLIAGLQVLERFTEISIDRLTREETATLARQLARTPLEEPALDQLFHETEGNPLFVVETLRAGWQPGQHQPGQTSARVQAVINARLAQLSDPAHTIVGLSAAIGRAFGADLLAVASGVDEDTFVQSLDELWRRRILRDQGSAAYDFSHDKLREVAYLSLSPALRRRHHQRIAEALERLSAANPEPVSAQIAAHYDHAGMAHRAVAWYERAAEVAQQMHANTEAARLIDRALDLVDSLPNSREYQTAKLRLLTALLVPLVAAEGYWSHHMIEVQHRALDLSRILGIEPAPPLLRSMALASLSQGDFNQTKDLGERLRARGQSEGDDVLLVEGEYVLGVTAFWQGQFTLAREHFEAGIRQYRPEHGHTHLVHYGNDPKVVCQGRLALTLWFLGRPDAAVQARDAALALAEEIGHPLSLGVGFLFSALLALELGEVERFREYTLRAAALRAGLATSIHIPIKAFRGYVDVLDGRRAAGIARIQRAREEGRGALSAPGMEAILLRLLLAACAAAGDARTGLAGAEEALGIPRGTRVWEAEAHRLRGEFLATLGGATDEIEAEFEAALQVAQRQAALALELRAAASLTRYRVGRGNDAGAQQAALRLAAIIAQFPEGRDTADLQAAFALLTHVGVASQP